MSKLTDTEVRGIIAERLSESLATHSELATDREKALDCYFGRPMGNEMEGRSQVVSKDLMDTIEWIMPSLMRVFCTQQAVKFDPVGPEDEDLAKQETGYVDHVFWKKNDGFMILYEWMKTLLVQKVGYVKYYWEDAEKTRTQTFSGLTDEQLALTLQTLEERGKVEITGREQAEDGTWSVQCRVTTTYGCAKIEGAPPEEVIVDRNCRGNIKKSRFVAHLRRNVTRSELIEMGYARKRVEELTSYDYTRDMGTELARDTVGESTPDDRKSSDWASEELTLLDCYTYIDEDDDGIAELRNYLLAGNDTLENEEAVEIQWSSATAIPNPFRHVGLSLHDLVEDLQRIHTALDRGLLDNVYFTNAPRNLYDKNSVSLADLQINRPGANVGVDGPPAGSVVPIAVQPIADRLLPVIDYIETKRERRTGVGRMNEGVDADVLAQSTKGAYMDAKGAANQRIEAIARIFAQTGLSDLYSSLHGLLNRHQDRVEKFKLRNEWVETNPAEWDERTSLTVAVGLGNSSKEEVRANLGLMAQAQEKAAAVPGLVQPKNVFALANRIQAELGFENEAFFTNPESPEYEQFMANQKPPVDPYVKGKEIDAQVKTADIQARGQEKVIELAGKREELAAKREQWITELEVGAAVDLAKPGIGAEVADSRGEGASGAGRAGAASERPAQ